MNIKLLLLTVSCLVFFACKKEDDSTFIVSAQKMIDIASNDWPAVESQLKNKNGYQYTNAADNLSNVLKATVSLPAVDDSNSVVKGTILLNIAPDNRVFHASFDTEPQAKAIAYAMLLNYNSETLRTLPRVSSAVGGFVEENGNGGNTSVGEILTKISSGHEARQLGVSYKFGQKTYSMIVFKEPDGRYIFSYRAD